MFIKYYTMRPLLFILTLAILSSCTPEKRVARLIKKFNLEKSDTIWRIDTVISQSVKRDSTFFYNTKDSVIIREGRLVMKYFYNNHDSTVYLQGECLPDTIYRNIATEVNSVSVNATETVGQKVWSYILNNLLTLLLFLLVLWIGYRNRR